MLYGRLPQAEHENEKLGLYHFGVWVDDLDDAEKHVVEAGGSYLAGRPTSPNSFYEAKYSQRRGVRPHPQRLGRRSKRRRRRRRRRQALKHCCQRCARSLSP
jgi:hypothetical protein